MIYEDALINIEYPEKGTVQGHLVVTPKTSVQTVDELDEDTMAQLSFGASYAATVLFETLGAQGTNIILNELPVRYDIIARMPDDGWKHQWTPQAVDQTAMDDVMEKISHNTPLDAAPEEPSATPETTPQDADALPPQSSATSDKTLKELEDEENYLIRQLTRIP